MAEKEVNPPSDLQERVESSKDEEKMECEDVVSGTGSVDVTEERTDSYKATGSFEKDTLSPMTSDTTSGLEMRFESLAGTPSGAEAVPLIPAIVEEAIEEVIEEEPLPPPKSGKTSAFEALRKIISPPKKEKNPEEDSAGPKDKSISASISFLKTRFRASKSMSPPEQSIEVAIEEEPSATGEGVSDDQGTSMSPQKKAHKGLGSKIKKSLSSMAGFFSGNKGSATSPVPEAVGLMVDPETSDLAAGAAALKVQELTLPVSEESGEEETTPTRVVSKFQAYWTEGLQGSLTSEQADASITQLTDAPSISSDAFVPEDETLSKTSSNKTSEEAAVENLDTSFDKVPEMPVVMETSGQVAVESKEVPSGQEVTEKPVTVESLRKDAVACSEGSLVREVTENPVAMDKPETTSSQTSPPVQETSESIKAEKTPVKRQAETPAQVLIQEKEGDAAEGTSSPWKKANVTEEPDTPEQEVDK